VRAVVSLGATLGKSVVAEGIETETQLSQLRELGCGGGQGFHLARPLMPDEVDTLIGCVLAEPPRGLQFADPFDASAVMPLVRH
jgi:predicted signal transduction protein with EAL and GGDEF domain